jgi:predicted outer membrane repeat protein
MIADDAGHGERRGSPIVDMGAYEYQAVALYVDDDAPIGGDGSTWDEALRFLQDALLAAGPGVRVKVAGGIYRPDASSAHPDGTGDRETSFILADGVRILGGYAGQGAADPDERNPDLYETMLSGDLNGDDGPNFTNYEDNSRHIVVAGDTVSRTAVLDGLTIRAGHADGDTADPLVAGGAGLLCDGADLVIRDCRFTANLTGRAGGALYTRDGTPLIVDCLFDGNAGGYGAALNARTGHPRAANCRFLQNASDWHGGAIANEATLRLANCFFAGNRAALGGGAINMTGHLFMSNCTVVQNEAPICGGVRSVGADHQVTIANTLFWGNARGGEVDELAQLRIGDGMLSIDYTCLQGWTGDYGGAANNGDDPLFVDELGPDGLPGTGDEDYDLLADSSCIDSGDNMSLPPDVYDLDADGDLEEFMPLDINGEPRVVDDPCTEGSGNGVWPFVDRGACEMPPTGDDCEPNWSALGSGVGGDGYPHVSALTSFDDGSANGQALYVGGFFTTAGTMEARNIARWDGVAWSPLGSGVGNDDDARVYALAVFDDGSGPALYVGGDFSTAGGTLAHNIAKWDGANWSAVGAGTDSPVYALAVFDDGSGPALYACGAFSTAGGGNAERIAKWDGSEWSALGDGLSSTVLALAVFDDGSGSGPALYAGGTFSYRHCIAKWDGQAWSGLGQGVWYEYDGFYLASVNALAVFDDGSGPALCAGGFFVRAGNVGANNIAKWDGMTWSSLGDGTGCGYFSPGVEALAVFDDGRGPGLYAAGNFATAGGISAKHVARWNGDVWRPLGVGTQRQNYCLTVFDDGHGGGPALYAGGRFNEAGGVPANYIARWGWDEAPACPGDLDGDDDTDMSDLGILLAAWELDDGGDLDGDGDTDISDLGILLADFGCGT